MRRFTIIPQMIETHRFAARPVGRRTDPTGMSDAQFYAWRASLTIRKRRFIVPCVALTSNDLHIAGVAPSAAEPHTWQAGSVVLVDDEMGGIGHDAGGVGFFPLAYTELV